MLLLLPLNYYLNNRAAKVRNKYANSNSLNKLLQSV